MRIRVTITRIREIFRKKITQQMCFCLCSCCICNIAVDECTRDKITAGHNFNQKSKQNKYYVKWLIIIILLGTRSPTHNSRIFHICTQHACLHKIRNASERLTYIRIIFTDVSENHRALYTSIKLFHVSADRCKSRRANNFRIAGEICCETSLTSLFYMCSLHIFQICVQFM